MIAILQQSNKRSRIKYLVETQISGHGNFKDRTICLFQINNLETQKELDFSLHPELNLLS